MHLRQCDVALVHDHHIIFGEVVQQAEGARTLGTTVEVTRVVLNAGTVAQLLNHLQIVLHTLLDALCLHRAVVLLEEGDALAQVEIYLLDSGVDALLRGDEEIGRKDRYRAYRLQSLATRWVDSLYRLDLVVEECNAVAVVAKGGHNIYRVALDAERSGCELQLRAGVERLDQVVEEVLVINPLAYLNRDRCRVEVSRISDTIQTRNTRHYDHIPSARQQSRCGTESHLLNLVVDREIFLDVCVCRWEICLGLIVIVV